MLLLPCRSVISPKLGRDDESCSSLTATECSLLSLDKKIGERNKHYHKKVTKRPKRLRKNLQKMAEASEATLGDSQTRKRIRGSGQRREKE